VPVSSLINDSLALVFPSIDKHGIVVTLDMPDDIPNIKGDRTRLIQVVQAILENGIEAILANAQERSLSIKASTCAGSVTVEFRDSGCGFSPDTATQLFKQGFTTKQSSSGLPLHSCLAILESHSATLELASSGPGKGAVATLRF